MIDMPRYRSVNPRFDPLALKGLVISETPPPSPAELAARIRARWGERLEKFVTMTTRSPYDQWEC